MDKPIAKLKLLTTKGEVVDAILYCHQETTTIAGTTYYLLKKDTSADASGTTLSASTGSVARVVWGKFVYPLTGIAKILASTIYATYRAYTGGGTVNAEIDILIRKSDGTVRTTIATGVSKSANLGTSWATYTGANYSFAEYTVVDQTDYLEIDYIANVTAKKAGAYAYLRIDDNTLALADQTRSQEWKFTGVATLEATDITISSATLNGKINGTETMTIRGFEWGTQSGNYTDSWTESGTFPPDTFSHTITGLTSGRTYYFRAKAYSDATGWIYGNELSFTTLTPIVTTHSATDITRTSATLNGETANFTATIRGFDWGKQSGNYTDSWTEEGSFPPSTFSHTITGLDQDTTYYFRAKAYSPETGWIYGDELSFTTLAPGWLTGWSYRKNHVINPASGAGTNYQVMIIAHYGSGTDGGADVYLNQHCRTDFGDVRFTKSDGTTLLDYWMEEKVDSDYAVFWVEVADDLSTNPATIYCYTPDTDVMTEKGWVNLQDFVENKMNLKVATLNPETGKVEYHYPLAYVKLPFKGEIIHFKSKFFDLKVTPEHRMWYKTRSIDKWRFGVASEIPPRAKFRRDFPYEGREQEYFVLPEYCNEWKANFSQRQFSKPARKIRMDDWLRFLGFYISEGSLREPTTVVISQEKEDVKPLIEETIRNLGYSVYYTGKEYLIHDVQLVSYLKQFGHAEDKFIPEELKTLSKRQLKILLDALLLGDGTKRVRKGIYEEEYYGTISKRLADDVQEIALKVGYTASIHRNSQGLYIVYLGNSPEPQNRVKIFEEYEGYVYCLIVPNHLLFVKRNGKPLWSGNCYYGKSDATTTSNGDNTFPFFDDFLGTSLDPAKWGSVDSGIVYSVANSVLEVTDDTASHWTVAAGFHHSGVPSQNSFEIRLKGFSWTQSGAGPIWKFGLVLRDTASYDTEISVYHNDAWSGQYGEKKAVIGSNAYSSGYGTLPQNGTAELVIRKDQNNNVNVLWDGRVILGSYVDTVTLTEILLLVNRYSTYEYPTTDLDAVIWRKYVSPEPSHGSWGSEETVAILETIVAKDFPMDYLPSPAKAEQLTSKVSGATITKVSQDYPLTLIKKDKAAELKSKFTAT